MKHPKYCSIQNCNFGSTTRCDLKYWSNQVLHVSVYSLRFLMRQLWIFFIKHRMKSQQATNLLKTSLKFEKPNETNPSGKNRIWSCKSITTAFCDSVHFFDFYQLKSLKKILMEQVFFYMNIWIPTWIGTQYVLRQYIII